MAQLTGDDITAWDRAQDAERSFHCNEHGWPSTLAERRAGEIHQHLLFAGALGIDLQHHVGTVTDIGCGPTSLLLRLGTQRVMGGSVAVDPLKFTELDERQYQQAGVRRVVSPAETYRGEATDEVWMYNCLQHTIDPQAVLATVRLHAKKTIRIFEWTHVPTDNMHLHKITESMIINDLSRNGFGLFRQIIGRDWLWGRSTSFYAGIWHKAP